MEKIPVQQAAALIIHGVFLTLDHVGAKWLGERSPIDEPTGTDEEVKYFQEHLSFALDYLEKHGFRYSKLSDFPISDQTDYRKAVNRIAKSGEVAVLRYLASTDHFEAACLQLRYFLERRKLYAYPTELDINNDRAQHMGIFQRLLRRPDSSRFISDLEQGFDIVHEAMTSSIKKAIQSRELRRKGGGSSSKTTRPSENENKTQPVEPIKWKGYTSDLVYLLKKLEEENLLGIEFKATPWKLVKDHFVDRNGEPLTYLRQAWENVQNNKSGKSKNGDLIDELIHELRQRER